MNSIRLRYFITVAETESIRKASEVLHISPAALSKAIKQLEYEVGTTLIVPAGRGIFITEKGRELAQLGQPLIEGLDKLKIKFNESKTFSKIRAKPIRIGSFELFTTYFFGHLIGFLPKVNEVLLRELIPGQIENKLLTYEIDYGITLLPIPIKGVLHLPIITVEMEIFGRKDTFSNVPFSELPFVVPAEPIVGSLNKVKGLDGWSDTESSRFIKYRVDLLESGLELCRQGKAVAYLPSFIAKLHNNIVKSHYSLEPIRYPETKSNEKCSIYLAKRENDPTDLISDKLIEAIINLSTEV